MEKVKFSVDKIDFVEDSRNTQFGVFKLYAFASGDNAHSLPVSVSTLKKTAYTIYNKPLVWKYEWFTDDAAGHEEDEIPCGFVYKENNPLKFTKMNDGRIMLVVNALVWKKYSGKLMEIFQRDDATKSVSVEIEVNDTKELSNGKTELLDFVYTAITILGQKISPAIPLARAEVLQFSEDKKEYEKVYHEYFESKYKDINFNIPKNVKTNIQKGFELKNKYGVSCSSKILSIARFLQNNNMITVDKVEKFCSYIPNFNFSDITESTPPTNEYVKSLLCGGQKGVEWMKVKLNEIQNENTKLVTYFAPEDIASMEKLKIGEEEMAINKIEYGLKDKFEDFFAEIKNEDGMCKYAVKGIIKNEDFVVVEDMSDSKYFKMKYEDSEDGFSVYLEDATEMEDGFEEFENFEDFEEMGGIGTEMAAEETEEEAKEEEDKEEMAVEETEMAAEETEEEAKEEEDKEETSTEDSEEEEDTEEMAEVYAPGEDLRDNEVSGDEVASIEGEPVDKASPEYIQTLYSKIETLEIENAQLLEFKANIEIEKKNFEVEKTLTEITVKCPNMPVSEIEIFRESATKFSLDNLDGWKNAVKAKAFTFATANESVKNDVVRIAWEIPATKGQSKKTLWT